MGWQDDALQTFLNGLVSVGGIGAVVAGVSTLAAKLLTDQMLAKHNQKLLAELEAIKTDHASKLEAIKTELATKLEATKRELDILKETAMRFQNDKIIIYRLVIDMVSRFLGALDAHYRRGLSQPEAWESVDQFNQERIQVYGYLAMLAPQAVMDAQDRLVDNLILVTHGEVVYDWSVVRENALMMLNAVRDDIGIGDSHILYNGNL